MSTPALTSRLDAVNTILTASGESPVSSLAGTTVDTANAESVLDEVLRDVQTEGWHFNTEKEVSLSPDGSSLINLPTNVAKIDLSDVDTSDVDIVQRGTRLYDRKGHTYEFEATIKADIVYLLPFEELPEAARRFIVVRAARIFHDRFVGSETTHRFTEQDELRARVALVSANVDNEDANIFTSNPRFWYPRRRN
jgi:hypothetical protein